MDLSTLVSRIQSKVQDPSFDPDQDIVPRINQGVGEIASRIALPSLTSLSTVTCGDGPNTDVPSDFHANLHHAYNQTTGWYIRVVKSLTDLMAKFPAMNNEGSVTHICRHGDQFYFQNAPGSSSAETILVAYSTSPPSFSFGSTTSIDCIPHELQTQLLVPYACREIYDEIEDGVEGVKVNWNTQNKLFEQAMEMLRQFLGVQPGTPTFVMEAEAGEGYFSPAGRDVDDYLI